MLAHNILLPSDGTTKTITIEFEGNEYVIEYTKNNSGEDTRHFNVIIKEDELKKITGESLQFTLLFRDNLEELNYPPTKGERDLHIKKTIISEIFKNENINYTV